MTNYHEQGSLKKASQDSISGEEQVLSRLNPKPSLDFAGRLEVREIKEK